MTEKTNKSHPAKICNAWWNNRFYTVLIAVALIGGGCAFFIPPFITSYGSGDSLPILRQTILAATGGVLAILTLWENRRKNDQEHTRQVHAERRSRYTTAIEQLADEKAPIRLGGVYTLVKLVDEWLTDEKTLPNEEDRREEGQAIINSLCAYIRSPFDLASKFEVLFENEAPENYEGGIQQFTKDQARFREEKEIRLTILDSIKARLSVSTITQEDKTEKLLKGSWSDFDYDFSNAHFFYHVDFSKSRFGASSNFTQTTFLQCADFSGVTFIGDADFSRVTFIERTDFSQVTFTRTGFSWATFAQDANFSGTVFTRDADFSSVIFTGEADFSWATFTGDTIFIWATFTRDAFFLDTTFTGGSDFSRATFAQIAIFSWTKFIQGISFSKVTFTGDVDFSRGIFTRNAYFGEVVFTGDVDFSEAIFNGFTNFSEVKFTQSVSFSDTTFNGFAGFRKATFAKVNFSMAKFIKTIGFSGATFEEKPIFTRTIFGEIYKARFSHKADPEGYSFEASHNSPYKIETEEQEHNGVKFIIPKGTELFDPDDPSS